MGETLRSQRMAASEVICVAGKLLVPGFLPPQGCGGKTIELINLKKGGARAKAAQITCNRTLKRFHGKENDCVVPFLIEGIDGYGGNEEGAFRLRNYQKCADEITDNYKKKLGWYSYTK